MPQFLLLLELLNTQQRWNGLKCLEEMRSRWIQCDAISYSSAMVSGHLGCWRWVFSFIHRGSWGMILSNFRHRGSQIDFSTRWSFGETKLTVCTWEVDFTTYPGKLWGNFSKHIMIHYCSSGKSRVRACLVVLMLMFSLLLALESPQKWAHSGKVGPPTIFNYHGLICFSQELRTPQRIWMTYYTVV